MHPLACVVWMGQYLLGYGVTATGASVALKVVPQASGEVATAKRLASASPTLPVVPVLRIVDHFRTVLGTSMAVLVMPYVTPMLQWVKSATPGDVRLVIASMGEVCCPTRLLLVCERVWGSFGHQVDTNWMG